MTVATRSIRCPRCQATLVVPATLAGRDVACSQCKMQVRVPDITPPPTADSPEVPPETEVPRRNPWVLAGTVAIVLLASFGLGALGVVLVAGYMSTHAWPQRVSNAPVAMEDGSKPVNLLDQKSERWTDASERSIGFAGAVVTIDRVALAPIRFRADGENRVTDELYLLVDVTIHNQSRPELNYRSWYSYRYETEEGEAQATCRDGNGTVFLVFPVPGADRIESHFRSDIFVERGNTVTDSIVFRVPAGYERVVDEGLRLTLPAAAFGDEGYYRFSIPVSMVENESPL